MPGYQQTLIGAGVGFLIRSWDKLGIKDWANKNISWRQIGDGLKSAANFYSNGIRSIGRGIRRLFGERKRSEAPAYVPPLPPTTAISNHQLSSGWQNEGFQSSGENFRSNQGGFVSDAKTINDYVGFVATGIEVAPGSFRLGTLGQGFSPKYYASAWRGNQYATTYNIEKLGRGLGWVGLGVGTILDLKGVYNYNNPKMGPQHPDSVHPGKAKLNLGMGLYGIFVNPIPSVLYSGIDMFYPGGWIGAAETAKRTEDQERRMTGHSFFSNSALKF